MKQLFQIFIYLTLAASLQAQCIELVNCTSGTQDICDLSANNADLWNNPGFYDPLTYQSDLAESPVGICITARETCTGVPLNFKCSLFLDLDQNGSQETLVDSDNIPPNGDILYNNIGQAGTQLNFDQRPVPLLEKLRFALDIQVNGADQTACFKWLSGNVFQDIQLPMGTHRVKWTISNGNTETTCEYFLLVRDCKNPTVVCINGLSANIMPTQVITVWSSDFLQYAEDNYTLSNQIQLGIRKSGTGTGFPTENYLIFDCSEIGVQTVELWAQDLSGNSAYCTTYIIVKDDLSSCTSTSGAQIYTCAHLWCDGAPLSQPKINYTTESATGQVFTQFQPLDQDGCALYNNVPLGSDVSITPLPNIDSDVLNGVNVLDILAMLKHILAITPLSPYAQIAADINKSGSVTVLDIVELRKLLLGIYAEFPNNESWRFIPADFVFPNPNNPFQSAFPALVSIPDMILDTLYVDFKAIKIGDVNCSAQPTGLQTNADDRNFSTLISLPDIGLKAGEETLIQLNFEQAQAILAFQAGLAYDPDVLDLSLEDSSLPDFKEDSWVAVPGELRWLYFQAQAIQLNSGTSVIQLRIKAKKDLQLSEVLRLSAYPAQVFDAQENRISLVLAFGHNPFQAKGPAVFAAPNPFTQHCSLFVNLLQDEILLLEIYDSKGALAYRQSIPGNKGDQVLDIPAEAFHASGLYHWKLSGAKWQKNDSLLKQ
jgi:hypothetical protein